jgi:hypothetical protein
MQMSDAYRAGKYHAEAGLPSNLDFYTPHTFAWFDYLEGLRAGHNEVYWSEHRHGDPLKAKVALAMRESVKEILEKAGRK